jgi:hypothetical protein
MTSNEVKGLDEGQVAELFKEEHLFLAVRSSVGVVRYFGEKIKGIEKVVKGSGNVTPGV